ncbi:MAG: winged helix-turn-helix transcriptional regulator [Polyangiaceae bacterium]
MATPKPGQQARGSSSGRPVMVLLDALGRRWALRILWELRGAPLSFRALRSACDDASPSVLNQRLTELRDLALLTSTDEGYALTPEGERLGVLLVDLDRFAQHWAKKL